MTQHRFRLLITATNENGTSLQQYYFMSGQMQKLSKIEVGVPKDLKDRVVLSDKDVVVAKVYDSILSFSIFISLAQRSSFCVAR